ncbi:hypothetical protein N44_03242 [Microcystis aeruginosa NIES-44]|uniref:Uncharacterized protein n=1 Tax=Microcystis aeruginosa NIES-44 TaxID=449439 RepID=A0A0A1VXW8_MICAE|nr:hypothetical protein N44_03242 [Microcystis aeruginosa NIES-44]
MSIPPPKSPLRGNSIVSPERGDKRGVGTEGGGGWFAQPNGIG